LRIGYSTVSPIGTDVHPEAVRAVARTVELLARLGHDVEEAAPAIDGAALAKSYLHVYFGQIPAMVRRAQALGARLEVLDKTVDKIATDTLRYVPFTQLANLTGTPAMSMPLHWTADGLPLAR